MPVRPRIPTTVFQDLKQHFVNYPEHYFASVCALVGITYALGEAYYNMDKQNKWITSYCSRYTVIRPDDPRAWRLRTCPDMADDDPRLLKVPAPKNETVSYAARRWPVERFDNQYRRERYERILAGEMTLEEAKQDEIRNFKDAGYAGPK